MDTINSRENAYTSLYICSYRNQGELKFLMNQTNMCLGQHFPIRIRPQGPSSYALECCFN